MLRDDADWLEAASARVEVLRYRQARTWHNWLPIVPILAREQGGGNKAVLSPSC